MDANRARIALILPWFLTFSGCQLFQPASFKANDKPAESKKKEATEVVAMPTTRPSKVAQPDESSNAIVQWARSAMKAREQARPIADQQHQPAEYDVLPAAASDAALSGTAGPVFEATIPVALAGDAGSAPDRPAVTRPRDVVARRDKPPALTNSPVPAESSPAGNPDGDRNVTSAPPKVGAITARPAGAGQSRKKPEAEKANVALNNPENASAGDANLKDLLDDALAQPGDATFREQLDRKMLLVMKGEYEKAREPFVLASPAQQEMGKRLLESLIAVRDGHSGDPSAAAADVLAQVGKLRESLVSVSDLALPTFSICRAVRGFGQYDPIEPAKFLAGRENQFVAYCEIRDFASEQKADGFSSNFSMRIAILDRTGDEVHQISTDDIADKCRTRRSDCFLSPVVRLPATLSPGEYVVRITIQDKIGKKAAEKVASFRVVAKN